MKQIKETIQVVFIIKGLKDHSGVSHKLENYNFVMLFEL